MKWLLFLIFVLIGIIFIIKPVNAISKLHIDGRYIKNETGDIIFLRGVNKHGFEDLPTGKWFDKNGIYTESWNLTVIAENLDAMKAWGMNIIRIHTSIDFWLYNTSNFRQNIKDLIQLAGEKEMYVIFDAYCIRHYGEEGHGQDPMPFPPYSLESQQNLSPLVIPNEDIFVEYWRSVASELKDFPNVIFEIFNEPVGIPGKTEEEIREDWHRVWQKSMDAIRSTGADQIIIIQWGYGIWINLDYPMPPNPRGDLSWINKYPFNDSLNNLLYSTHIYRDFCHRSSTVPSWDRNRWQYKEIELCLNYTINDYIWNKSLIIGEIGANMWHNATKPSPDEPSDLEKELAYFNNTLSLLNELEISYVIFWWWPWGTFQLLKSGPNYQPNEAGEITINNINPSVTGKLVDKNNQPLPTNIAILKEGSIIKINQTNSSGHYKVSVPAGVYDINFDFLPPLNFFIKLFSIGIFGKVENVLNYLSYSSDKISFSIDTNKIQKIQLPSERMPTRILMGNNELKKVNSYSELTKNSWFYDETEKRLYISQLLPTCSDGTPYDECSSTRPYRCENGNLVERCDLCYCYRGLTCDRISNKCYIEPKVFFEDDFEWGNLTKWDIYSSVNDSVNVTKDIKHRGNYSGNYTVNGDGWYEYAYTSVYVGPSIEMHARFYVLFEGFPIEGKNDKIAYFHGNDNPLHLLVFNNGTSAVFGFAGIGFNNTYGKKSIKLNEWNLVEIYWNGVNGTAILYLNESIEILITNINNTRSSPYSFYMGVWANYGPGNPHSVYFDDVVVSNAYIGP